MRIQEILNKSIRVFGDLKCNVGFMTCTLSNARNMAKDFKNLHLLDKRFSRIYPRLHLTAGNLSVRIVNVFHHFAHCIIDQNYDGLAILSS